jgi:hypothetical protein
VSLVSSPGEVEPGHDRAWQQGTAQPPVWRLDSEEVPYSFHFLSGTCNELLP